MVCQGNKKGKKKMVGQGSKGHIGLKSREMSGEYAAGGASGVGLQRGEELRGIRGDGGAPPAVRAAAVDAHGWRDIRPPRPEGEGRAWGAKRVVRTKANQEIGGLDLKKYCHQKSCFSPNP